MSLQNWILVATALFVGIPAVVWFGFLWKKVGVPTATFFVDLPPNGSTARVLIAVDRPLHERLPQRVEDFRALSVVGDQSRVGLALDPGDYWLYDIVCDLPPLNVIHAVDLAWSVLRSRAASLEPLPGSPVIVRAAVL